ncbi:uncharacterized protein EHS24_004133 [Apiotrichum porosum]|uniref:Uncharacterized protein n=1 Tax=Apiotrichum porosum TaxID=105984 RepID=A0A427Y4F1_9TREE|nr:uncharacterized protein EHS24_004133 [Apiotrichum porosum]RSH85947.1 hypothetical protein EHS24_004133 [Apiotrichum porosum]
MKRPAAESSLKPAIKESKTKRSRTAGHPTQVSVKLEAESEGEPELTNNDDDDESSESKPQVKAKRKQPTPRAKPPPPTGEWTAAKREIFMDRVIEAGYKSLDLAALAEEQLANQLAHGRKGSFRDKAVKLIKGEEK